jgi:glycogen(starch) synthase
LSLVRAVYRGYRRGFSSSRKYLKDYRFEPDQFRPYKQAADLIDGEARDIILVTQGYPPSNTDGISRYNHTLAKELADRGHRVYVVTKNTKRGKNIFYRDKHWVYYHDPATLLRATTGFGRTDDALALAKSAYATAAGISMKSNVDVIVVPLWDVEGTALIRHKLAPTILTLMSPLKKVVETQWYWLDDPSLDVMYDLERYCIENSDAVMAISVAIKKTIGDDYRIDWAKIEQSRPVEIIPLGVDGKFVEASKEGAGPVAAHAASDRVSVLFVGRFEKRKGIDLLLEAIPGLLERHENVEFHLVGNSDISEEHGVNVYSAFVKKYRTKPWFQRVIKHGYVSDDDLAQVYRNCDIFVAPSRYESFGIIFIEAMAFGKPLVGADVGGIPEILQDGTNGLLFRPGDSSDLSDKISALISDGAERMRMGEASRALLKEKFGAADMGLHVVQIVERLIESQGNTGTFSAPGDLTRVDQGASP